MKSLLRLIGWLGLGLTVVPSILFLFESIELEKLKLCMTIGMIAWFVAAIAREWLVPSTSE